MNPTLQKVLCFSGLTADTVNRTSRYRFDIAGKGLNVCRVLSQLGKQAVHLTPLGGDFGPLFLALAEREGMAIRWVESGSPVRFCYTLINDRDGSVTELIEDARPVEGGTEERIRAAYEALLPEPHTVVIAGTRAPGFSDDLVPYMVRRAKEEGRRVVLDLRGSDLINSLPHGPDVIKPNLLEFAATFGPDLIRGEAVAGGGETLSRIRELCRSLCAQYRCGIVLTRGSKPVWYAQGDRFAEFPLEPVKPVNTTGSGDAFTAGLAAALGEGASLAEAVAEGVRCGGLNAGFLQVGTIREL
ncbi:MAG: PfkB family carbohydrate kinase [Treponema sp.]|jgi:1-phosphofructokinase/tagatose 6-phosphate kinase|nr:PfkB family carbohydrate kinase [Treponema sp.]